MISIHKCLIKTCLVACIIGLFWHSIGHSKAVESSDPDKHSIGMIVKSPMPCVLVKMLVCEGQEVKARDELCIIESMKMQITIAADAAGIINTIFYQVGTFVGMNFTLISLRPPSTSNESTQTQDPAVKEEPSCQQTQSSAASSPFPKQDTQEGTVAQDKEEGRKIDDAQPEVQPLEIPLQASSPNSPAALLEIKSAPLITQTVLEALTSSSLTPHIYFGRKNISPNSPNPTPPLPPGSIQIDQKESLNIPKMPPLLPSGTSLKKESAPRKNYSAKMKSYLPKTTSAMREDRRTQLFIPSISLGSQWFEGLAFLASLIFFYGTICDVRGRSKPLFRIKHPSHSQLYKRIYLSHSMAINRNRPDYLTRKII
jgi:acetyl-CoA carboxylase biotin carboxyl carrier protein